MTAMSLHGVSIFDEQVGADPAKATLGGVSAPAQEHGTERRLFESFSRGAVAFGIGDAQGRSESDTIDRPKRPVTFPADHVTAIEVPRRRSRLLPAGERFEVLQQWEATVIAVDDEWVNARLVDQTTRRVSEEFVDLAIEDFQPEDRPLLRPGAVFYWTIGYRTVRGTRSRASVIAVRRLLPPSPAARARARREAAALTQLFAEGSGPSANE